MEQNKIYFTVEYLYSKEQILMQQRHPLSALSRIYKIMSKVLAVLLFLAGSLVLAAAISRPDKIMMFVNAAAFFAVSALLFFHNRISAHRRFKAMSAVQTADSWPISFEFSDILTVKSGFQIIEIAYDQMGRIAEDEEMFYLYLEKSSAFRLPKDAFTKGSPREFADFIRPRLGALRTGAAYKGMALSSILMAVVTIYVFVTFGPMFLAFF